MEIAPDAPQILHDKTVEPFEVTVMEKMFSEAEEYAQLLWLLLLLKRYF